MALLGIQTMKYTYSITDSRVLLRTNDKILIWEAYYPRTKSWSTPDVSLDYFMDAKPISSEEAKNLIKTGTSKTHIPPQHYLTDNGKLFIRMGGSEVVLLDPDTDIWRIIALPDDELLKANKVTDLKARKIKNAISDKVAKMKLYTVSCMDLFDGTRYGEEKFNTYSQAKAAALKEMLQMKADLKKHSWTDTDRVFILYPDGKREEIK